MPFGFKTVRELISEQTIRVNELASRVTALETEWDDTYDKMTRKAARDRKRVRDELEAGSDGPTTGVAPPVNGNDRLPPRIAARRRGYGATPP